MCAFVRKNLVCDSLQQKVLTFGSQLIVQALGLVSINEGLSFQPITHLVNRWKHDFTFYSINNDSGSHFLPFLPPANEVCEGYVFTGICLSIRGSLSGGQGSLSRGTGVRETPRTVKSRRYTSYWNAFLSNDVILVPLEFLLEFNFSSFGIFIWIQLEKISSSVIS